MKQQIREQILSLRNAFEASPSVIQEVIDNFYKIVKVPKIIAGYHPIGSELDIIPLLESLKNDGCKIALPVMNHQACLDFYEWKSELVPSTIYKNILEPYAEGDSLIPDVIIVPLIACDHSGNRIGSGKAMYDKTIASLRAKGHVFLYIGVCFDFQLLDKIPAEDHDQKLDIIVTDKRVMKSY